MFLVNRPIAIYCIAALFSVALSLWCGFQMDVINPDAICYLQSAQAAKLGIHAAMNLCGQAKWPFYSVMILAVTKLTHLSFMLSAYLLDGILSLISVIAFIAIVRFLSNKPRLMWLAAIVILLAHEFNAVRQDIIRDHGFWAFYLVSIWCLLNYFRESSWRFALGWSVSLFVATLFRIEGAVFLLLLPFLALFDTRLIFTSRIKAFLQLHTLTLSVVALLAAWLIFHPTQDLTRLNEVPYQFMHGWQSAFQNGVVRANALGQYVLTTEGARDSYLTYVLMLASSYGIQVIKNLSLIYALLVIYAWFRRVLTAPRQAHLVLWGYVIVNVIVTLGFLAEHLFLSKRYLMALSLVLMIWVPFALDYLIQQWSRRKLIVILIAALIVLSSLGGIVRFGYSKAYIYHAGNWLAENVPENALIYSNDIQLMYYSNHFGDAIFSKFNEFADSKMLEKKHWKQFDYLALRENHQDKIQYKLNLIPVKVFANRRGDQVVIYKVSK